MYLYVFVLLCLPSHVVPVVIVVSSTPQAGAKLPGKERWAAGEALRSYCVLSKRWLSKPDGI